MPLPKNGGNPNILKNKRSLSRLYRLKMKRDLRFSPLTPHFRP
jgi:hypothetical protein